MKSVSVKKIDSTNGAPPEVAVRVDSAAPGSPVDTQIWFDKTTGELAIQANGVKNPLRTRVLPSDPISPVDGESWINSTTMELKFKSGGSVHTVSLGSSSGGGQTPAGDYYAVLTQDELGQLANAGLLYPNYLVDAFNEANDEAVDTNVAPQASALRLSGTNLTGQAKYELESSTYTDMVEGIAVITPQSFKPLTYVDNLDGTSTMTVAGDCTGFFADLKQLLMYKEITVQGATRSVYVTGGDNKLAILNVIGTPVFSSGSTTIVINNSPTINGGGHIDILTQLGVSATSLRFYPLDLTMKAGGQGAAGSQDTVYPSDAHGLDALRTLGGDVFTQIAMDLSSNVNKTAVQHSPNRQYWLICVVHTLPADFMEFVFYFSVDNLSTLQRMTTTIPVNTSFGYDQLNSDSRDGQLDSKQLVVSNSGKFLALVNTISAFSGDWRPKLLYGDLTAPTPNPIAAPSYAEQPGSVQPSNPANNYCTGSIAMDADDNYVIYTMVNQANHVGNHVWYKDAGATFVGVSDAWYDDYLDVVSDIGFYESLEGEKQAVHVSTNVSNGYPQWFKKKISQLPVPFSGTRSDYRMNLMFSNETVSQPETAEGTSFLIANSFDADKIRSFWWSNSNERSFYTEVHLEDVITGQDAIQHIAFSALPASGQWNLDFMGQTTTPSFSFGDNASVIQTRLQALSTIAGAYVTVTGNYTSGFDVEFVGYPTGLGKAPQPLLTNPSDTLLDSGSAPVGITITTSQPGIAPIFPHYLSQYRHNFAGVGDKVLIVGNRQDADYDFWGGTNIETADFQQFFQQRLKKHPSDSNRAFMVWEKFNNQDNYGKINGLFFQMDHLDTFQGMFNNQDNGVSVANQIAGLTSATQGDRIAKKITWDRNITVRAIAVQGLYTWNNYAQSLPRSRNLTVRAKLVADSGGLPNEGSLVELSPTKYNLQDVWNNGVHWMEFRFNTAVTSSLVHHLVVYIENLSQPVSTDWPNATGGQAFNLYGAAGAGSFVKNAGVWNAASYDINYRAYDFFMESVKSPDTFQYPKFDLTGPSAVTNKWDYMTIRELQLEYNDAQTELLMSWTFGGMVWIDGDTYTLDRTLASRKFNIPAADTFASDQNSPNATEFLGYDPSTYDHNALFHVRLSDPQYAFKDRFGNPAYVSGNTDFPFRGVDQVGNGFFNYHGTNQFQIGSSNWGHTQDARFKSGWATKFAEQGDFFYYMSLIPWFRSENFILELEIVPTANDIAGYSGGLSIPLAWGNGNGWYFGLQNGKPEFVLQNNIGPAFTSGGTTAGSAVLTAGQYYGIRITRSDDQLIRMYTRTTNSGAWTEVTYSTQTNAEYKHTYPDRGYVSIGRYIDGTSYRWDGMVGEVRFAYGASFLNGENIADQRPMLEHYNVGEKVMTKKIINVDPGNTVDKQLLSEVGFASPQTTTGKVAAHDQLLKYRDLTMPQGKKLAATLQLDRVSTEDAPAVQGFLLNYEKQ